MAERQPKPSAAPQRSSHRSNSPLPELPDNAPFVIEDLIGKGSFATVYKGQLKAPATTIAVKVVHRAHLKRDKRFLDNFEAEMAILKTLKHPHVVSLIDVFQTQTDFHLLMEFCSLGDLSFFMRKRHQLVKTQPFVAGLLETYPSPRGKGLHETLVTHLLIQLSSALGFLRTHNLVHRDIKPQNLLLRPPPTTNTEFNDSGYAGLPDLPVLKVADFGFARFLPSTSMAETLCGSPLYMAPEILRYEKYNAKADLWSVGAVVYEMVTGKPPFPAANHIDLLKRIEEGKDAVPFPEDISLSPHLKQVIRGLLKRSPADRIGFEEFFSHPALDIRNLNAGGPAPVKDGLAPSTTTAAPKAPPSPTSAAAARLPNLQIVTRSPGAGYGAGFNTRLSPQASAREEAVGHSRSPSLVTSRTPSPEAGAYSPGTPSHSPRLRYNEFGNVRLTSSTVPENAVSSSSEASLPGRQSERLTQSDQKSCIIDFSGSLDRDYVVVEKRTVEVNALADDLASSPPDPETARKMTNRRRRLSSIGYGTSPTNALAQALIKSSARLFGTRFDAGGVVLSTPSELTGFGNVRRPSILSRPSKPTDSMSEQQLLQELESLAAMGKVVSLFADVKHANLVGSNSVAGTPTDPGADKDQDMGESMNDPMVQDLVGQEALALYLKSLAIFALAMDKAAAWWEHNELGVASAKVNNLVQWIRDKFNDSVERADESRGYILDANALETRRPRTFTVEKLLFDRALEMSRAAAVQELSADDLATSEMNYGTALWMLRALVEVDKSEEPLDDEDKELVERLLAKIAQRLVALRRRTETSITASGTVVAAGGSTTGSSIDSRSLSPASL